MPSKRAFALLLFAATLIPASASAQQGGGTPR